jgi:cytochrome b561
MAAQAQHFPHSLRNVRGHIRIALHGCATIFIVIVGVVGLVDTSQGRRMLEPWIEIHVLFGLMLCGLVLAQYRWRLEHAPRFRRGDVRELSRHLARVVYSMLYMVLGVRLGIGLAASFGYDGMPGLPRFDDLSRNAGDSEDFHMLLNSGVCALVWVRILAFRLAARLERQALI